MKKNQINLKGTNTLIPITVKSMKIKSHETSQFEDRK